MKFYKSANWALLQGKEEVNLKSEHEPEHEHEQVSACGRRNEVTQGILLYVCLLFLEWGRGAWVD